MPVGCLVALARKISGVRQCVAFDCQQSLLQKRLAREAKEQERLAKAGKKAKEGQRAGGKGKGDASFYRVTVKVRSTSKENVLPL